MFSRRRVVVAAVVVVVTTVAALLVTSWRKTGVNPPADTPAQGDSAAAIVGASDSPAEPGGIPSPALTPTSETLIADALQDGDLSYEESLLQRAYAITDDPRLEPAFRSRVIDWEAWAPLLAEINAKEATLSKDLLEDLQPFRVRPNDPASIFNRSRAEIVKVQLTSPPEWEGEVVFFYASMERGVDIVKNVWEFASKTPGPDGIKAVNTILPLDFHFPGFALRNWNQETVPRKYETRDKTFRANVIPMWILERPLKAPGTVEIGEALPHLSSLYYRFTPDNVIRKVSFQSLVHTMPQGPPRPHVWAIRKINQDWKDPEDWTEETERTFCRDVDDENVTELILIVSNSHLEQPLPRQAKLRVIAEDVGCEYLDGWAREG